MTLSELFKIKYESQFKSVMSVSTKGPSANELVHDSQPGGAHGRPGGDESGTNNTSRAVHNDYETGVPTGTPPGSSPGGREKRDVASMYRAESKPGELTIEGKGHKPAHPIGRLKVFAHSRKWTVAATSPATPDAGDYLPGGRGLRLAADDLVDAPPVRPSILGAQKLSCSGGDDLAEEMALQLPTAPPLGAALASVAAQDVAALDRSSMPAYMRVQAARVRPAPAIDRSLLLEQSNVLQVVAMPPVKAHRPLGKTATKQPRQRSPAGGHAGDELEKIQELPRRDPVSRQSRSHGLRNYEAAARPRLQTSQNNWRTPASFGKHQLAFSGSPQSRNYAEPTAAKPAPINFSLLIDARKSSLMGETHKNSVYVNAAGGSHGRGHPHGPSNSERQHRPNYADSQLMGQSSNRQDLSSDSVSHHQNILNASPKTHFQQSCLNPDREHGEQMALATVQLEPKKASNGQRPEKEDEYGLGICQKPAAATRSIELGGRGVRQKEELHSGSGMGSRRAADSPLGWSRSRIDNARLSEMSQRMDGQSTGRNSRSRRKDKPQPMNGDIMETMALVGGQGKSRTEKFKFQFNLRGGCTQRSPPEEGELANTGAAGRSSPGQGPVELLQLGIVGKSAFSSTRFTGREARPEKPSNAKAAAATVSKRKETDKVASTSRSGRPFAPRLDSNDTHRNRSINSPTSGTSQRNMQGQEQMLLQIQEAPKALRLPLGTSDRGPKVSSSSPKNANAQQLPTALVQRVMELSLADRDASGDQRNETDGDVVEQSPQPRPDAERAATTGQSPADCGREVAAGDSTDTVDAQLAADIQQYIIQESQTVYNNMKSFNGERRFNQRIMSKLKVQAELSRAKRQQNAIEDTARQLGGRTARPGNGGGRSPLNSHREMVERLRHQLPELQPSGKEEKIVVFGVRRGSGARGSRKSTGPASPGKAARQKNPMEIGQITERVGHELVMTSLQAQSDRRTLYNEQYAAMQQRKGIGGAMQGLTHRTQPKFDISKLTAIQTSVDRHGGKRRDSDWSKRESMTTTLRSPRTLRHKPHVVEIGSFSLIPDAKIFGGQAQKNGTEYMLGDRGTGARLPPSCDLMSTQRSQEQSQGKTNETPINWTPLGQPKLVPVTGADAAGQSVSERRALEQTNRQISMMQNFGAESRAAASLRAATCRSAVNEDGQSKRIETRGSDLGGHDTTDGVLLGTSRDLAASEYLPEAASFRVNRALETPLEEKVIDENDEYQHEAAAVEPTQEEVKITAIPELRVAPAQVLSKTATNLGFQVTSGDGVVRMETAQVLNSSSRCDPEKIEETVKKNTKGSNSGGIESCPSSRMMNSSFLQKHFGAPGQPLLVQCSNARIGQDGKAELPLKPSDVQHGQARKISSPATEHAYLKVESILSHGDDKAYTKEDTGLRAGGTTYSSPRGLDRNATMGQNAILMNKPRRLGSRPELQNQVVYQVMGSRSQKKRGDEMRISERGSSAQKDQQRSRPGSAALSEASNLAVARLRQASVAEGEQGIQGWHPRNVPAERVPACRPEQEHRQLDSLLGSSTRFPPVLTDRSDAKAPTETSSYLDQQQDHSQIQAAIRQLQGIIKQKKQQFKVRNSVSMLSKHSKLARPGASPQLQRGVMPPKYGMEMNSRRSRLLDYFPQHEEDDAAMTAQRQGSFWRQRQQLEGLADQLHAELFRQQNCRSQCVAEDSTDFINIRIANVDPRRPQPHTKERARGLTENQRTPPPDMQADQGRPNFNSNTGWRKRSQNFSMTSVFHVKKRIQIENMVSCNFPKLLQLSHRALDYGNLYSLPSLVDRKKLTADAKRASDRSRLLSQHQSRPTSGSPASECAVDDMIQATNPKKQLITNIAPNTCSTVAKWMMYKQISRGVEAASGLPAGSSSQQESKPTSPDPERLLNGGQSEWSAGLAEADNQVSKRATAQLKAQDGLAAHGQQPDDQQSPMKLTDRLFPLRKRSLERSLALSAQDVRQLLNKSSEPPESNLCVADCPDQPAGNQAAGRLDSQELARERTDELLPAANLSGGSQGRSVRQASTELRSHLSSAVGSALEKVEHRRLAVPYALPEASYQSFERSHRQFLDDSRQRRITQAQKIRYLLKHV